MPKKWLGVLGCCLIALLAGCSESQSNANNGSTSPVMNDVYNKSVSGDVYSKGQISPP
ncbi:MULTISPECIES: hypothetical protein [Paenibacillus]|uniref:Uncharacterized protein n=1 Tax=Paenibacillus azoreducens TaxID=116718 RepID=A0A919YI77_9BACL|nr:MULTISPECIES: hypothetical protein [Paenibacillus]MBE9912715.1 hypothetical protein [Paenibacillus donghaensis]GIO49730.1 hypothetical protein J34TS1_44950 [Paenibacillus azoreducens]